MTNRTKFFQYGVLAMLCASLTAGCGQLEEHASAVADVTLDGSSSTSSGPESPAPGSAVQAPIPARLALNGAYQVTGLEVGEEGGTTLDGVISFSEDGTSCRFDIEVGFPDGNVASIVKADGRTAFIDEEGNGSPLWIDWRDPSRSPVFAAVPPVNLFDGDPDRQFLCALPELPTVLDDAGEGKSTWNADVWESLRSTASTRWATHVTQALETSPDAENVALWAATLTVEAIQPSVSVSDVVVLSTTDTPLSLTVVSGGRQLNIELSPAPAGVEVAPVKAKPFPNADQVSALSEAARNVADNLRTVDIQQFLNSVAPGLGLEGLDLGSLDVSQLEGLDLGSLDVSQLEGLDLGSLDVSQLEGLDLGSLDVSQLEGLDLGSLDVSQLEGLDLGSLDVSQLEGLDLGSLAN